LNGGRAADALAGPVDDAARFQLLVGLLPEELAGLLVKAHADAEVDRLFLAVLLDDVLGVARLAVVGADVDLAAGDDRAAVRLRTEIGFPEDVLALFDVPLGGDALGDEVREVARGVSAEHGPVAGILGRR